MALQHEDDLIALLGLSRPPVAISFHATAPAGVRRFMGQVPSGCSFWSVAASAPRGKSAFQTAPGDHYNCPVGAYTHRVDLPEARAGELDAVLGTMVSLGYLAMSEVPGIPRWTTSPAAVVYSRLGDAPLTPNIVVLTLPARAGMLLGEAARAAGSGASSVFGRPTCMAIPAAAANGATMSLGCVGNRVYTGAGDGELYMVLRGADVEATIAALRKIVTANQALAEYHGGRKQNLTQAESPSAS